MQGVLLALVPMFAWGSIGFVANKFGGDAKQQTLGMTLGAFVFALIVFLFRMPTLTWQIFLIGFIGGLLWAIGQFGQFNAMKYMGVSVASPLSSGSQLVIGSLIGVFAFQEWTQHIQFVLGFIAMIVLVVGFYFSSKRDPENTGVYAPQNSTKGLTALVYSTLGYVIYVILFNNLAALWFDVHFDTLTIIMPMSVGMIVGALVMGRFKIKMEKYVFQNMLVGVMWGIGNIFMLMAASEAGNAIAFSFSQLGIIISTLGGIFFLGEKKTKKEMVYVSIGIVLFVVGAILLAIVKSKG
ncbi:GRP family sugar transporter [Lactococcus taiwanensis]|jgi:glucose uptake protein|uniref:GRP family sugar transporter n=1 Tax=Lactococcus taiwanensis TaxID=1151742 RepID=A0AA45KHY4_9LACT|nr:GRP family sugar transporter [Lactococcus taiwanensis]KZK37850.1 Glucose uptake-like protein [Lactococcus cremoris]QRZ10729.1 GRP family sugar transporter [Lactococcus taiwanensis]QSE76893.1 GRP family sugar transporter [Lactococcus taiwanensis]